MRQVLRAGALGRPRGMGWGGRREGRLGWGTHVNPWLIHVNVRQKPLQYCKVISLQLIKINEKNNNKVLGFFLKSGKGAKGRYPPVQLLFNKINFSKKEDILLHHLLLHFNAYFSH